MTKDDIIRMAMEAGSDHFEYMAGTAPQITRFAKLLEAKVRADEREACAHMVGLGFGLSMPQRSR